MLGLPSENVRVALTSDGVMAWSSKEGGRVRCASARGAHGRDDAAHVGTVELGRRLPATEKDVEQVVVGELHQQRERGGVVLVHRLGAREEALEQEVVLEQAATAAPAELAERVRIERARRAAGFGDRGVHQTARLTISSLILPMARVGLSCFGQTSTQFMIVWQRKSRYGSSRLSRRSLVASSRLSAMKRYACSSPAGPTNLSGFHQKLGHDVEQLAHRMHS